SFGSMLSAVWIVIANSWQQTPAGYHIVGEGITTRAEIVDFWAMIFNPSSMERLSHTLSGAWLSGAFLVLSVAAYYLLKKKHIEFAKSSFKIALLFALFASLFQLFTGHQSAMGISRNQPAKLAAFEAHYDSSAVADLYLFGWVSDREQKVNFAVKFPGMLSFLISGNTHQKVTGLNAFDKKDRPPVNIVFQSYHFMVAIGVSLIALSIIGIFLWWRKKLFVNKWLLRIFVIAVLGPQIANQLGWISAEVGRQPWIVYGLLRTSDAISKAVTANQIWFSLILFTLIYALLFVLFIYLLNEKIKHGPEDTEAIITE
ncbi:MAG: cytochrome ubiquinol oxidase subunit I, partial [Bacteroidota bacterium]